MEPETKTSSTNRCKGKGRGRGKKKVAENDKVEERSCTDAKAKSDDQETLALDLDADITQLEAPTFSTIKKGPPEPMLRLNWDHRTHLIGEKVINPMIHCCDKCSAPILIYGRMIPCKHVFCLSCAEGEKKVCPRCQEKVIRIEKTGLGTVFMCTFGGSRYGNTGCRRTYLSQRDLLAHINHRHVGTVFHKDVASNNNINSATKSTPIPPRPKIPLAHHNAVAGDPRVHSGNSYEYMYRTHSPSSSQSSVRHQWPPHQPHVSHHSEHQVPMVASSVPHNNQPHSTSLSSQIQRPISLSNNQHMAASSDFMNQMMVTNYPPPNSSSAASGTNVRSNLITIQLHDSNVESNTGIGIPVNPNFSHPNYSSQFSSCSSPNTPFPVPPPAPLPQALSQYFSGNSNSYPTSSSQKSNVISFNPNSQTSSVLNPLPMLSSSSMMASSRRPPYSGENVTQSFPGAPPHRWHQPPHNLF